MCLPHYVDVADRSVGIERSRILFRRAARPRHWKTTGSPELGNVEAVTYFVNLDKLSHFSARALPNAELRFLLSCLP